MSKSPLNQEMVNDRLEKAGMKLEGQFVKTHEDIDIRCFCGKVFKTTVNRVFSGVTKSCGCSRKVSNEEVESRLIALRFKLLEPYKTRIQRHKFQCHCGRIFISTPHSLFKKGIKSCGCIGNGFHGKLNSESIKWAGYGEISKTFWNRISKNANGKSRPFDITIEYVWDLFIFQGRKCAISGVEIDFSPDSKLSRGTASLDRIDSGKGYVVGNVQWVHKEVNNIKTDMEQSRFIEWCKKIADNNKKDPD